MNRVTLTTPRQEIIDLLAHDGYVLLEGALTSVQLEEVYAAYDRQLELYAPQPGVGRVEVGRIFERDPNFEQLMDNPPVIDIVSGGLGPDIELASSGQLDHKLPHTKAHIGWHNDFAWMPSLPYPRQNYWIRCTYFMSDVTAENGPFTLLPGSHLRDYPCPADEDQQNPRWIDGQVAMTGSAGSCLINNTEIWHTNSPNNSNDPRRLITFCYKHGWMKQWQDGYETSPEFANRQTDPLRKQLCGLCTWNHGTAAYPAAARQPVVIR